MPTVWGANCGMATRKVTPRHLGGMKVTLRLGSVPGDLGLVGVILGKVNFPGRPVVGDRVLVGELPVARLLKMQTVEVVGVVFDVGDGQDPDGVEVVAAVEEVVAKDPL